MWFQSQAGCIPLFDFLVRDDPVLHPMFQSQTGCIPLFDDIVKSGNEFSAKVSIPDGLYSPFRRGNKPMNARIPLCFNPRRAVFPFSTQAPGAAVRSIARFQSQTGCIPLFDESEIER